MINMTNEELFKMYASVQAHSNLLVQEIRNRNLDWKQLIAQGMQVEAMRSYRAQFKCSFKEAYDVVQAHIVDMKVHLLMQMSEASRQLYFETEHSK